MKKRRWLLLVLPLVLLSGCAGKEDEALLELFRQDILRDRQRIEDMYYFSPGAGLFHQETIRRYGGYGAELTYALYETETAPATPQPGSRYLYLREDGPEGPSWSRWRWDGKALQKSTAIPEAPAGLDEQRLIGEFSVKLEPSAGAEGVIPRPSQTDQTVLGQIQSLLEEQIPFQDETVVYVNTQALYAVVVSSEDRKDENWRNDVTLLDNACEFFFRLEENAAVTVDHMVYWDQHNGQLLRDWFYDVARADAVIRLPARSEAGPAELSD